MIFGEVSLGKYERVRFISFSRLCFKPVFHILTGIGLLQVLGLVAHPRWAHLHLVRVPKECPSVSETTT